MKIQARDGTSGAYIYTYTKSENAVVLVVYNTFRVTSLLGFELTGPAGKTTGSYGTLALWCRMGHLHVTSIFTVDTRTVSRRRVE